MMNCLRDAGRLLLMASWLLTLTSLLPGTAAGRDLGELIQLLPNDANAIVVIDAEKLFSSGLAQREEWRKKYADSYTTAPFALPPKASRFAMSAEFDFTLMEPHWEAAVMELSEERTAAEIAAKTGGAVDSISGKEAVHTSFDAYIVRLDAAAFAVYRPANRQAVSRWVARMEQPTGLLSPYLAEVTAPERLGQSPLIMALDLRDIFPRREIRVGLGQSKAMAGKDDFDLDQLAGVLAGLRGMTLEIQVADKVRASLNFDFDGDVTVLQSVAKPLVLEVLGNMGASIDEMRDWQATAAQRRVALRGELSSSGLRRFLSIFSSSTSPAISSVAPPPSPPPAPAESDQDRQTRVAEATQRYFNAIQSYLDELFRSGRNASPYQVMLWLDNYAERIERLPNVAVDAEMVAYGKFVSSQLRQMLAAMNDLDQQSLSEQSRVRPNVDVRVGVAPVPFRTVNYGGYYMRRHAPYFYSQVDVGSVQREREQIQTNARTRAEQQSREMVQRINTETDKIRAMMSQRFGITF